MGWRDWLGLTKRNPRPSKTKADSAKANRSRRRGEQALPNTPSAEPDNAGIPVLGFPEFAEEAATVVLHDIEQDDDGDTLVIEEAWPDDEAATSVLQDTEQGEEAATLVMQETQHEDETMTFVMQDAEPDDDAETTLFDQHVVPDDEAETTLFEQQVEQDDDAETTLFDQQVEQDDDAETTLFDQHVEQDDDAETTLFEQQVEQDDDAETTLFDQHVEQDDDAETTLFEQQVEPDDDAETTLFEQQVEPDDEAETTLFEQHVEPDDEAETTLFEQQVEPDDDAETTFFEQHVEQDDDAETTLFEQDDTETTLFDQHVEPDDDAETTLFDQQVEEDIEATFVSSAGEFTDDETTLKTSNAPPADEMTFVTQSADPDATDTLPVSAAKVALLGGVVVPGYDILAELGRGGMGVVYKAQHQQLQRMVALKMILAGVHSGSDEIARFRIEAEAIARLQHPNIVQLYEIGEHEGRPFFSLELVDGGALDERLKEEPLPPQGAAHVVQQLARAMDFAHQQGIVHRDLKPANILLASASGHSTSIRPEQTSVMSLAGDHWSRSLIPKITDFGLAKRFDEESASQTQSGAIVGTPAYMSPEQADGKVHEIGPAADIYGLGAILYVMLTGRPPFKAANVMDVIRQVINQEPLPPSQLEPSVPLDMETICLKCLQKVPGRRYETAGELADDLNRYLHHEPIHARPISTWERMTKWGKRRPMTVALMGVTVLAIASMIGFVVWHNTSLQRELDLALDEQKKTLALANAAERELERREKANLEEQRVAKVRNEGQALFDSARVALAKGDLPAAQLDVTTTLTLIRKEPQLADLSEPANGLLKEVKQKLKAEVDQRAADERERALEEQKRASQTQFEKFADLRNEAQFLGSLYTGMDLAANVKASRTAVHSALDVYGVSPGRNTEPRFDEYLTDSQRDEVLGDCYQLFLILAETEAQSAKELQLPEQSERLHEAMRLLDQALQIGSPSRAYHLRRARYLRRLGDDAAAASAEKLAQAAEVVDVLDHFLMADEYFRRAELNDAIREFEHVLQSKPDHFWAQYLNGLCLLRQNRHAEAKTLLTACLAHGRDFVWLYLLRGFAHGELLAFDAADDDFDKALQMPLDENSRYVLFVNRGVLRIRQERTDEAIADLNAAIKLKPTGYQAFVNLAQAYRQSDNLDAAMEQLDRAVEREPSLAHVYRLRARLRVERGEPVLALGDFEEAIQRETSDSEFLVDDHFERGRLLMRAGQHEASLESFDAALELRNDHSLAQRMRAEVLFHLGRFQDVTEAFDRYLETGTPLESVYRGRGLAKSELGEYPGAIDDFTKALELLPTSEVQTFRGWMHVICEAPKLAERDFMLAIELDPQNGDAYCGRGFVRALQKNFSEAITDAEEAVRLGPPSSRLLYNAARIHAQSAPKDDTRVFELLSQALAELPASERPEFWSTQVRTDAALNAIRTQPRFIQMEKELLSAE